MDRQKIGRVIELADQFELMLELRADLAVDPFGIAQRRLFPSEPLEFLLRLPGGIADLVGILIFELVEAEGAAACKFNGSRDGRRVLEVAAEQPLPPARRFEIAVGAAPAPVAECDARAFLQPAGYALMENES